MTRTTIKQTGLNTVELRYTDDMGEPVVREFHTRGRYVYDNRDRQVCVGLDRLGNTLTVERSENLLDVIRAEWKAARAADRRDIVRATRI